MSEWLAMVVDKRTNTISYPMFLGFMDAILDS